MALLSKTLPRKALSFSRKLELQTSRQLAQLSAEVSGITEAIRKLGEQTGRGNGHLAQDLADQAWTQGAKAAQLLSRQAVNAGKAVRADPVPVVVAVGGFLLFLSLLLGRRR